MSLGAILPNPFSTKLIDRIQTSTIVSNVGAPVLALALKPTLLSTATGIILSNIGREGRHQAGFESGEIDLGAFLLQGEIGGVVHADEIFSENHFRGSTTAEIEASKLLDKTEEFIDASGNTKTKTTITSGREPKPGFPTKTRINGYEMPTTFRGTGLISDNPPMKFTNPWSIVEEPVRKVFTGASNLAGGAINKIGHTAEATVRNLGKGILPSTSPLTNVYRAADSAGRNLAKVSFKLPTANSLSSVPDVLKMTKSAFITNPLAIANAASNIGTGLGRGALSLGRNLGAGIIVEAAGTMLANATLVGLAETGAFGVLDIEKDDATRLVSDFISGPEIFGVETINADPVTAVLKTADMIDHLRETNVEAGYHGTDGTSVPLFVYDNLVDAADSHEANTGYEYLDDVEEEMYSAGGRLLGATGAVATTGVQALSMINQGLNPWSETNRPAERTYVSYETPADYNPNSFAEWAEQKRKDSETGEDDE